MNRPKLPKKEFKDNEREIRPFLNGLANTITNILDYLEKDKRATDSILQSKRESELTVQERQNRRNKIENELDDIKTELKNIKNHE